MGSFHQRVYFPLFQSSSGRTVTVELRLPCKVLFFHVSVKSLKYKRINSLSLNVTDVEEFRLEHKPT